MDRERCRFCKQLGHWERDCPEKKKAGDSVKTYQDWSHGEDYYGEEERLGTYGEIYQWLNEIDPEDNLYPLEDLTLYEPPQEEVEADSLN